MKNNKLFLAPKNNKTSRENFQANLENGYPHHEVEKFLYNEEKEIIKGKNKLYIWGNQKAKQQSWDKLEVGDFIAFYTKGIFTHYGKCILKKHSKALAQFLWGKSSKQKLTWEYTFFIDEIRPTSIPLSVIIDLGKYSHLILY